MGLTLRLDPLLAHTDERADIPLERLGVGIAEVRRDVVEQMLAELRQRRCLFARNRQEICRLDISSMLSSHITLPVPLTGLTMGATIFRGSERRRKKVSTVDSQLGAQGPARLVR